MKGSGLHVIVIGQHVVRQRMSWHRMSIINIRPCRLVGVNHNGVKIDYIQVQSGVSGSPRHVYRVFYVQVISLTRPCVRYLAIYSSTPSILTCPSTSHIGEAKVRFHVDISKRTFHVPAPLPFHADSCIFTPVVYRLPMDVYPGISSHILLGTLYSP